MRYDTDVVIIGAGPTGLTLANLLALRGVSAVVVEARNELIDYPRAIGIDDEALRTMQAIGLVDAVLPHTVPDQKIRVINARRRLIAEIAPTSREFGWPRRNGFVQPLVDEVLLDGLNRFAHVDVRFGHKVIGLDQDGHGATVTVQDETGATMDITGRYVVGCEGGRSFTRGHLGLEFPGTTLPDRGLVIDVADDPLGSPNVLFAADPKRGYGTMGLPHGIRRWEFLLHDDETDEIAMSDDFVYGLLADQVPDPRSLRIIRRRVYSFGARVAPTFRKGRVLLAGDAAHIQPVTAGQGWNSCMRDALNLAWKLVAVINGVAGEKLLDTYTEERRQHVIDMTEVSVAMTKIVSTHSRVQAVIRDATAAVLQVSPKLRDFISSQSFKPAPRYREGAVVNAEAPALKSMISGKNRSSAVGTLYPQPLVIDAKCEQVLLDDALGAEWRIIAWNNDPARFLSDETAGRLERLGVVLASAVPATQASWATTAVSDGVMVLGDASGDLKSWYERTPFTVSIVRPDHVIAAECLPQDLDATVGAVLAAISAVFAEDPARPRPSRSRATAGRAASKDRQE